LDGELARFGLMLARRTGQAGSAYDAASSLIIFLLWIFYSAQILLFAVEFTQIYSNTYGSHVRPQEHAAIVSMAKEGFLTERPILGAAGLQLSDGSHSCGRLG
jgi:hypothetical protein